jgi:hypothetical protein
MASLWSQPAPGQPWCTVTSMRAFGVWVILGGCVVLLGLRGASPRAATAGRQDAPAALLGTVAIGPVTTLRGLAAYVEAVSPGGSAGLNDRALRRKLADAIGVRSLDGVDPTSSMYLLVVEVAAAALDQLGHPPGPARRVPPSPATRPTAPRPGAARGVGPSGRPRSGAAPAPLRARQRRSDYGIPST